ncbi:hypothetical protein EDC04DRAFT_2784518 [Pisolithus marmoratus]|nr:hypothetical protein EDC04DRAFT_2784518 [Pisolithus marmoratus]
MLGEVVVAALIRLVFMFGHTLSIFRACLPHPIICSPTKVCPVLLWSWGAVIIDDVHPSLAKVVSETNRKGRSGIVVRIDYDYEIICER